MAFAIDIINGYGLSSKACCKLATFKEQHVFAGKSHLTKYTLLTRWSV